jgi:M6 family metalloprotease-like protein
LIARVSRLVCAAILLASVTVSLAAAAPRHAAPRPCLVPPVPQKKSLPPPLGGAADPSRIFDGYATRARGVGTRTLGTSDETPITLGTLRILAIRVDFEDEPMDSSTAYFERILLFQKEHYETVSDGQFILEQTLAPSVYRLPKPLTYYGLDDSIGVRQAVLGWDAVKAADPEVDFEDYDQVVLFHAGPGQESDVLNDSLEQIWSVFFRMEDFAYYLPYDGVANGIPTDDRTAQGDTIFVSDMAMFPELETQDGFVFSPVGVVCHELGHALGLPDLYDTVAPENQVFAESQGIGSWDLMAAGTWNANGFVPAEFSAWSKLFVGWIDPVVVTTGRSVSLQAVELDRRRGVVKIPIGGDEYFLLENRSQDPNGDGRFNFTENDSSKCRWERSGADSMLVCDFDFYVDSYADAEWDWWLPGEGTGSGLLIWHIDDSVIAENLPYNTVNALADHKGVDLEEADGIQDMDNLGLDRDAFGGPFDTYRAGWVDRFGPDTVPDSDGYYGIDSGITVDQVSAAGPVMTFRVAFAGGTDAWPVTLRAPAGGNHVAVGQLDGDARREIVVADRAGNLYVLNDDGTAAWDTPAGQPFAELGVPLGAPLVADLDGDDIADVVVPGDDGEIFGWAGPDGRPLGALHDGVLVRSTNPMPTVELFGADLFPNTPGVEFGFGGARMPDSDLSRFEIYGVAQDGRPVRRGVGSLRGGNGQLPAVVVDIDGDGHREIVASVRADSADTTGTLQLHLFDPVPGASREFAVAPLPDTAYYSAPVVGDLDRNGKMDVVVTSSNGNIYALEMGVENGLPVFRPREGWPRYIFASGRDQVSLADVDGNGYLEVLAIETGGVFHVFNYHGTSLVSLPVTVPSEQRYFIESQLAPLAADLTADGAPEFVLPLDDGQVIGVDAAGHRLGDWNYFGGGTDGASPVVEDLDGDGTLELVTVAPYLETARVDVHSLGRAAGPPVWGAHRGSSARPGTLVPGINQPVVNGPTLDDAFAMPNPARESTRFHYRVGSGVETVEIRIVDLLGRPVRNLEGTTFTGTDNTVEWDLTGVDGRDVAPGVYLARLTVNGPAGPRESTMKLAVLR